MRTGPVRVCGGPGSGDVPGSGPSLRGCPARRGVGPAVGAGPERCAGLAVGAPRGTAGTGARTDAGALLALSLDQLVYTLSRVARDDEHDEHNEHDEHDEHSTSTARRARTSTHEHARTHEPLTAADGG